jgi:hypothetical protein
MAMHQQSLLKNLSTGWEMTSNPTGIKHPDSGVAPEIKRRLGVPVTCGRTVKIFLLGLPARPGCAIDLIHTNAAAIDHFIGISQYYIDFFAPWAGPI